jgi:hypothetical protein
VGELGRAEELGREVLDRCQAVGSPTDLAYATLVSLASVLRAAGEPEEALRYDRQARDGLINARNAIPAKLPASEIDPDARVALLHAGRRSPQMVLRLLARNAGHWLAGRQQRVISRRAGSDPTVVCQLRVRVEEPGLTFRI